MVKEIERIWDKHKNELSLQPDSVIRTIAAIMGYNEADL